jgi:hypothetical protein
MTLSFLVEMGLANFFPGLVLNRNSLNLHLQRSRDYRGEELNPARSHEFYFVNDLTIRETKPCTQRLGKEPLPPQYRAVGRIPEPVLAEGRKAHDSLEAEKAHKIHGTSAHQERGDVKAGSPVQDLPTSRREIPSDS